MLDDPRAIAIISQARQKNVATPKRSSRDFAHIFADFFSDHHFAGKRILDLGPGQYDFAREARKRGATVHNIDNDPAVIELGKYFGFTVFEGNLRCLDFESLKNNYDGVFCKLSINGLWFDDSGSLERHIRQLDAMLKLDGWGWIAPWNGIGKGESDPNRVTQLLRCQSAVFNDCGWTSFDLGDELTRYYGVDGTVHNHPLFLKNIEAPRAVAARPRLPAPLQRSAATS
jgi:hypothetical protein